MATAVQFPSAANVLLPDAIGSAASPGAYFGFGRTGTNVDSSGPRVYALSSNPNGVLSAPQGSIALLTTGELALNIDGGTTWQVGGVAQASPWNVVAIDGLNVSPTINFTSTTATHIEMQLFLATNQGIASGASDLFLNGDTTVTNYTLQRSQAANGTAVVTTQNANSIINIAGTTAPANVFSANFVLLPRYRGTQVKSILSTSVITESTTANVLVGQRVCYRIAAGSTDAISSCVLQASGASVYSSGCLFRWRYIY